MKKRKIVPLLLCCIMIFSSAGCQSASKTPYDQIIVYSIPDEPDSLDPQIAETSSEQLIVMNIFEGLVRQDTDGSIIPGMAENWTVSDDQTVYTFTLRQEICWCNGDSVTADDCRYGIERALNPDTGSKSADALYAIKNAEAVRKGKLPLSSLGVYTSDNRIIFVLAYPDPDFLLSLTSSAAMPCQKAFFTASGGQYGREADKLLSNGPFYIRSSDWTHGDRVCLRRNPYYHGIHKPIPAGVSITVGQSPANVCQSIAEGSIDCYRLPVGELAQARQNHLRLTAFGETVWGISFNCRHETLKYEEIRHALLSSLNRSFILQNVPESCTAAENIIPDTARINGVSYRSQVSESLSIPYSDTAKQDLQTAMKKVSVTHLPKLTILCSDDEGTQTIVNNIIQSWNELTGHYVNKIPVSAAELNDKILSGEYEVVIAPLTPENNRPESILSAFTSDSRYNTAQLTDSYYDGLISKIRSSSAPQVLSKIIQAEKYLSDKGIFYPLYTETCYYVTAENVSGIIFRPRHQGIDFFFAQKIPE